MLRSSLFYEYTRYVQGGKKVFVMENFVYSNNPHTIDDLKMAFTEYIRNMDRAVPKTVFENTVRRVNKCLETGEDTLNITCNFLRVNHHVHRDILIIRCIHTLD
jgi:hypothetical protein